MGIARELLELAASWRGERAVIQADSDTPYKCIGGTIFTLQRAGLRDVEVVVDGVKLSE